MSYLKNVFFYWSLGIIAISFLIYQLQRVDIYLDIGPIKIEAPIENVFNCFKNQFHNETLWRKFDSDKIKESVEIDKKRSNSTNVYMTITQNIKILNSENFKFKVILDSEMEIDQRNHSIMIRSVSRDEMVYANYYVKIESDNKWTILHESSSFRVYRMFSYVILNIARKEHSRILNDIKIAVEKDKNLCGI